MKRFPLNILNLGYSLILLVLIVATVIKINNYQGASRYAYGASCTSPPTYPIYVTHSYFVLAGGETRDIQHEAVNNSNGSNWGTTDQENFYHDKDRLPVALVINYACYRDRSFYADSLPLPTRQIEEIFKSSQQRGIAKPADASSSYPQVPLSFLIGIANKGKVVVWLQGKRFEQKLATLQVKRVTPTEPQNYQEQEFMPAEYFRYFFVSKEYEKVQQMGVDTNANYADSLTHYVENYVEF